MSTHNKNTFAQGEVVTVKINGEFVQGVYEEWHTDFNLPVVIVGGRRYYRKVHSRGGESPVSSPNTPSPKLKQSRFDVNTRFQFIEQLVDMVIAGESNAVIISGSGGLGKTYTVRSRLKLAKLVDMDELVDEGNEEGEDEESVSKHADEKHFKIIKGYSTPKALYRLLYDNRERLVIFDDCDSVWDNPTSVSLLKGVLDSYDTRRVSWLSEIKDEDLPQSFEFKGQIIFISNLSLTDLDQAVLSRSQYVDVSMTAVEKVDRIQSIAKDIRPEMRAEWKQEAIDLLKEHADNIGDLNIRTYLKVLDIRKRNAANWKDLAEYVITAL